MTNVNKQLLKILSTDVFQSLLNNNIIKIEQYLSIIRLLTVKNIGYDVVFSPGTNRNYPLISLAIYVNPSTTLDFEIELDNGCTLLS